MSKLRLFINIIKSNSSSDVNQQLRNILLKSCKYCIEYRNNLYCNEVNCCKKYIVYPEKGASYKVNDDNKPLFTMVSPYYKVVDRALTDARFTRYDECGEIVEEN